MAKEIRITVTHNGDIVSSRTSGISDIVLTHHSQAFRHEIKKGKWNYIEVELLEDGEKISSFNGSYESGDFDHYDNKIEALCKRL